MATGVEVAGFILAAIPLVISAIEHYRDGLDPLIEYSHYDRTLKGLRTRLRIQHNLFEGTLTRLLISDLSPSEAQSILAAIDAPYQTSLWRNPEIERQLQRRLGKQYETFMDVVCEMDAVMKKLMDKLDIDMQGKPKWVHTAESTANTGERQTRLKWEWRKIRRTFNKREREELLSKFERYNDNIAAFVQNHEILAPRSDGHAKLLIAYFELLRTHGSGLYEVLERSWKCSCSAPHNANLRLEAPKTVQQSLTFHVAFSFPMHSSDDEAPKEVWKETMITLVEEVQGFQNPANRVESMTTLISSQLSMTESKSEFRQLQSNTDDPEPPMAKSQSKTRKLLRFLSQKDQLLAMEAPLDTLSPQNTSPLSKLPSSNISFSSPSSPSSSFAESTSYIECLCAAMRTASSTPYHLGMLAKSTRGRRASITATNQPDQNSTLLLRLGSLLGSKQSRTRSSSLPQGTKLSREQRLRIAVALASAVLQFYNSPWLDETWSKKDIYFFFNGLNSDHRLVISSPYVSRSFVVSPTQDASQTNTTQETSIEAFQSSQIIDRTLFALGIVLIELCLNKTLEELRPETARPGSGLTIVDDYQLAIKQIEAVYEKGGSEYGYVCQRCLRCEFGVQDSKKRLDLDTFRHLVYEGVVAPLEEDLKKYSLYRGISV